MDETFSLPNWSETGGNLMFLISLPRSGSTMFQRILAGHPDIATLPEPWFMLPISYLLKKKGVEADYNADLAQEAMDGFLSHIESTDELVVESIRAQAAVLYRKALQVGGRKIFLDKTPRYYNIILELYRIFPDARFVFLLRNPIAVYASMLTTWYDGNSADFFNSNNYKQDLLKGPGRLLEGIQRLGERAVVVHYEELVLKPQNVLQTLFNNLNLSYVKDIHKYHKHPFKQSRFGDQVEIANHKEPIGFNVEKWRTTFEKIASKHLAIDYLEYLGPKVFQQLGYSYDECFSVLM